MRKFAMLLIGLLAASFGYSQNAAAPELGYTARHSQGVFDIEKHLGGYEASLDRISQDQGLKTTTSLIFRGKAKWRDWEAICLIIDGNENITDLSVEAKEEGPGLDLVKLKTPVSYISVAESLKAFLKRGGKFRLKLENIDDAASTIKEYSRLIDSLSEYGGSITLELAASTLNIPNGSSFSFSSVSLGLFSKLEISSENGEIGKLSVDSGSAVTVQYSSVSAYSLLNLAKVSSLRVTGEDQSSFEYDKSQNSAVLSRLSKQAPESIKALAKLLDPIGFNSLEISGDPPLEVWDLVGRAIPKSLKTLKLTLESDSPETLLKDANLSTGALSKLDISLNGSEYTNILNQAKAIQAKKKGLSLTLSLSKGAIANMPGGVNVSLLKLSSGTFKVKDSSGLQIAKFEANGPRGQNVIAFPENEPLNKASALLSANAGGLIALIGDKPMPEASFSSASPDDSGGVYLMWDLVSGASGYMIAREGPNGEILKIPVASAQTAFYRDKAVIANSSYYYSIAPMYQGKAAVQSEKSLVITAPLAPKMLVSQLSLSASKITFEPAPGAVGYEIYRAEDAQALKWVYLAQSALPSYEDSGLETGKTYYYRARAYNLSGTYKHYSPFTEKQKASISIPPPANIRLEGTGAEALIAWDVVEGSSGYQIFSSDTEGGTYKFTKTVGELKYKAEPGKYYKARCYRKLEDGSVVNSEFTKAIFYSKQ